MPTNYPENLKKTNNNDALFYILYIHLYIRWIRHTVEVTETISRSVLFSLLPFVQPRTRSEPVLLLAANLDLAATVPWLKELSVTNVVHIKYQTACKDVFKSDVHTSITDTSSCMYVCTVYAVCTTDKDFFFNPGLFFGS